MYEFINIFCFFCSANSKGQSSGLRKHVRRRDCSQKSFSNFVRPGEKLRGQVSDTFNKFFDNLQYQLFYEGNTTQCYYHQYLNLKYFKNTGLNFL